jgi:hypothetical protein
MEKLDHMTILGAALHIVRDDGRMTEQLTRSRSRPRLIVEDTGGF